MNGAESLVRTFVAGGVTTCFANPGTSEMHFVAALDRVPEMRCIPGLFEGVVTGAADGYARMTGNPALTLLHLAPGLGNGLANLHNAARARVPMINVIGDHATYHKRYDAPLNGDIEAIARPYSAWLRTSASSADVARDGAAAVAAARTAPGQIATLILPADTAWGESDGPAPVPPSPEAPRVAAPSIDGAAALLRNGRPTAMLLSGAALQGEALITAGRIAAATGATLFAPYSMTRIERGAGRVPVERIPYVVDQAVARLAGFAQMILVGAPPPVAFFAYPGKPSLVAPAGCTMHTLAEAHHDLAAALTALAEAVGATHTPPRLQPRVETALPRGSLTLASLAAVIAALIPDNAIVAEEAVTSGRGLLPATIGSRPHDWLVNTGGSIGIALPLAVGAAVACPDRRVLCLEADGSGMYTLQALWTMAREGLNVTTVIFANRSYNILKTELANVGAGNPGRKALDMLEIGHPDLDWCGLARGMGVSAARADDLDGFGTELAKALRSEGPSLVELVL